MTIRLHKHVVAWLSIAVASDTADILWELHTGHRLPLAAELLRAALLILLGLLAQGYLRDFILTLVAFLCGNWAQRMIEAHWAWFQRASTAHRMYADAWLAFLPTLLIALTLANGKLSHRDIYLTPGRLNARVRPLGPVRWSWLAPAVVLFLVYGLTRQLHYILGTSHTALPMSLAKVIALALPFAIINAANEEFRFRFVLFARGSRSVGRSAALWMTSINFGLAHWNGHPGGPTGVLTTALFAFLVCRSLIDTEGGLWAWLMHCGADIIILAVVIAGIG